jgi:hypothetical protein
MTQQHQFGKTNKGLHMLTNMHNPPAEGKYSDEHGNAIKPAIAEDYNKHGLCGQIEQDDKELFH